MNINLTIIVQVINFFVLYAIIKLLLIKPTARILLQEEQETQNRSQEIERQESALEHSKQERKSEWEQYRVFCAKNIPSITCFTKKVLPITIPVPESISFNKETINAIVQETSKKLAKKIKDTDGL